MALDQSEASIPACHMILSNTLSQFKLAYVFKKKKCDGAYVL